MSCGRLRPPSLPFETTSRRPCRLLAAGRRIADQQQHQRERESARWVREGHAGRCPDARVDCIRGRPRPPSFPFVSLLSSVQGSAAIRKPDHRLPFSPSPPAYSMSTFDPNEHPHRRCRSSALLLRCDKALTPACLAQTTRCSRRMCSSRLIGRSLLSLPVHVSPLQADPLSLSSPTIRRLVLLPRPPALAGRSAPG